ncbi:hypothetical protein C8F04DRAFT_1403543 [Mycena alexandri]|uniref:Uncharacterized protein n=1 Tax=Mycena alexandri TaxID=1745969 RepID=A0AAD6WPN9_9AGAR|nr:hypothetical protein C8F04DRAFT_1403543 [Mycena alexandri]
MVHLPEDIVKLLFDELGAALAGGAVTVGQCGLVCKSWLPLSRAQVFNTVALNERNAKSFFDVVETSSSRIRRLVRIVRLEIADGDSFFSAENLQHLGSFPKARTLYVETNGEWIPTLAAAYFSKNFPRLLRLSLVVSTTISMYDILCVVTPLQTLKYLSLDADEFNFMSSALPETYRIPPGLHYLGLDMEMAENFLEILFEMADGADDEDPHRFKMPLFSSLGIRNGWPQGRSFLGRYLHTFGKQIQYLWFDCTRENMYDEPEALSFCTGLQLIKLRLKRVNVADTLLEIVPHLQSPALTTIRVTGVGLRALSKRQDKWRTLDQAFSEERFAGLRRLDFDFDGSDVESAAGVERLQEILPLCAARGLC